MRFFKGIAYAETGEKGYVAKGPFVKERGGKTELYWSTYTAEGHGALKSVADKVLGEYVFDEFIFRKDGGHCMVFNGPDGKEYITFHQHDKVPKERMKKIYNRVKKIVLLHDLFYLTDF